MSSIHTNYGAIAALDTLRSITADLGATQQQVATGYRISEASQNSAYWSIATTMRSDNSAMAAVEDALGLGAAAVDTAYTGMTSSLEVVDEIKAKLVAAREPGVDRLKINAEMTQLKEQIYSIVLSSSFAGQNWLYRIDANDDVDKEIVGSFVRNANGTVAVSTISYGMSTALGTNHLIDENYHNGILTNVEFARKLGAATEWVLLSGKHHTIHSDMVLTSTTSNQDIEEMIGVVDLMIGAMADAASSLGAISKRISLQTEFAGDLRDTITRGVGRLVDADMNEASTRLKALQTREQLAVQALAIANASPSDILKLFQA